jgi:hypothetical protein
VYSYSFTLVNITNGANLVVGFISDAEVNKIGMKKISELNLVNSFHGMAFPSAAASNFSACLRGIFPPSRYCSFENSQIPTNPKGVKGTMVLDLNPSSGKCGLISIFLSENNSDDVTLRDYIKINPVGSYRFASTIAGAGQALTWKIDSTILDAYDRIAISPNEIEYWNNFCPSEFKSIPSYPVFGTTGLIAYLNKGGNAHDRGAVVCDVSSGSNCQLRRSFVDPTPSGTYFTDNSPNSWVSIDLGKGNSCIVKEYALQAPLDATYALRSWNFQASDSGQEGSWVTLHSRNNDTSFPVDVPLFPLKWSISPVPRAYRFFRIIQTGVNSNNNSYLKIPSLEIFGSYFGHDADLLSVYDLFLGGNYSVGGDSSGLEVTPQTLRVSKSQASTSHLTTSSALSPSTANTFIWNVKVLPNDISSSEHFLQLGVATQPASGNDQPSSLFAVSFSAASRRRVNAIQPGETITIVLDYNTKELRFIHENFTDKICGLPNAPLFPYFCPYDASFEFPQEYTQKK